MKSLRTSHTDGDRDELQARLVREWGVFQLKHLLHHYKHQSAAPELKEPAALELGPGDDDDNPLLTLPEITPAYARGLSKLRLSKMAHRIEVRHNP